MSRCESGTPQGSIGFCTMDRTCRWWPAFGKPVAPEDGLNSDAGVSEHQCRGIHANHGQMFSYN